MLQGPQRRKRDVVEKEIRENKTKPLRWCHGDPVRIATT